jgi:hypothetical protein
LVTNHLGDADGVFSRFHTSKSGVTIVPVAAITVAENDNVYDHAPRWMRAPVTLTVGKPFLLEEGADRQKMMREGTSQIMESLAELLPVSYRGKYRGG